MSKAIVDLSVVSNLRLSDMYSCLILRDLSGDSELNASECANAAFDFNSVRPGQFVEVQIPNGATFLRRPISVNDVDASRRELQLLVRNAGEGTNMLCNVSMGQKINVVMPLGNGFSLDKAGEKPLLVGGGVGVAPLLYLGKKLRDNGICPTFLLAAKTEADLLQLAEFQMVGDVLLATDDGSVGYHGLVTGHPALNQEWDMIYCCGPMPMMKGIARIANENNLPCEVSLENTMACGLGACLCCVEDTVDGHVCVCTEGPVFDIHRLKWFE